MKEKMTELNENVQQNGFIYYLKFVFSIIIIIFHGRVFATNPNEIIFLYGYIGVNFYFIVSGFLFVNSILKNSEENNYYGALKYLAHRVKPFALKLLITFIISFIILNYKDVLNFRLLFSDQCIAELFQISSVGYKYELNASWWYLSTMFILMFVLYPLVKKNKANFIYYYSPIIILFSLAITKYANINVTYHSATDFFLMNGFYIGLIYVNLGMISYCLSKGIRDKFNNKPITRVLITILELLGYSFVIINLMFKYSGDVLIAIVLTLSVALSFSNKSYTLNIFNSKVCKKLANFGFVMYLTQIAIRSFFQKYNVVSNVTYYEKLFWFVLATIAITAIIIVIEKVMIYIWQKIFKRKLKELFLR